MSKNRNYDWPALLTEFEASGFSQTEFCAKYDISPKYFSVQRSKRLRDRADKFVELQPAMNQFENFEGLTFQIGNSTVPCLHVLIRSFKSDCAAFSISCCSMS